jgi:hypothetical protein
MNASHDFYIGYVSKAPAGTAVWVRRAAVTAVCIGAAVGLVLVFAQGPFPAAVFEYGRPRTFGAVVYESPFPHAILDGGGSALLVAPGKHGAGDLIRGLGGRRLDFSGMRIQRDGDLMLEMIPGSIRAIPGDAGRQPEWINAGPVELRGEIVDSKCYLGVMNPGQGKVHRDCAVRCISGGVPPALIARDSVNGTKLLPMTGPNGTAINKHVLAYVAEPVIVRGTLFRSGKQYRIEISPTEIRRVE